MAEMAMKVLLIGERYSSNLGDGVIFETFLNIYRKVYPGSVFEELDISGRTTYEQGNNQRPKAKLFKSNIKKFLHIRIVNSIQSYIWLLTRIKNVQNKIKKINYKEFDYAIFTGGALFQGYFALPIYIIVKKLKKKDIPVIFSCCGLGKNNNILNKYLLKYAVNNKVVIGISIRDNLEYFKKHYLTKSNIFIEKILDPAFELKDYFNIIFDNKKSKKVGIGIININEINRNDYTIISEENYLNLLRIIIKEIDESKLEWDFFTNGAFSDYLYVDYICAKLNIIKKIKRPTRPIELINTINEFYKIISFRLHSLIIATSLGIPIIGIIWDRKIQEFANTINHPYFIDLKNNISQQLESSLKWLFSDKAKIYSPINIKSTSEYISSLELNKR